MNISKDNLEIILSFLIILIGLYLAFFKSYFTEKGKQLAIKEDLEEVTNKVEAIRTEFAKSIENVKAELNLLVQNKYSLANEQRNAILGFYEKYSVWANTIMSNTPDVLNQNNLDKEKEIKFQFTEARKGFNISTARINLFIKDENFIRLCGALNISTLRLQHKVENGLSEVAFIWKKINSDPINQITYMQNVYSYMEKYNKEQKEIYLNAIKCEIEIQYFLRNKLFEIINPDSSK